MAPPRPTPLFLLPPLLLLLVLLEVPGPLWTVRASSVPSALVARSPSRYVRAVYNAGAGEAVAMTCSFANSGASLGYFATGGSSTFAGRMILWYRVDGHGNEEMIAMGERIDPKIRAFYNYKILTADSLISVLFVRHVAANQVGFYKCAQSDGGPLHQIFYLNMTHSRLMIRHPPIDTHNTVVGSSVRLECNVSFTGPRPLIYWTRGRARTRGTVHPVAWGPVLTFHKMSKDLEDTYTCHADDFLITPVSSSFILRLTKTRFESGPRFLTAQYNHAPPGFPTSKPRYGHLYTLSCRSNAVPAVRFTWFKNGKNISEAKDPNLSIRTSKEANGDTMSELQFQKFKLADIGAYRCKAYNRKGSRVYTFRLGKIRALPAPLKRKLPKVTMPVDDEDGRISIPIYSGSGSGAGEKKRKVEPGFGSGFGSGGDQTYFPAATNLTRVSNFTAIRSPN